jgi:hypothetical protein
VQVVGPVALPAMEQSLQSVAPNFIPRLFGADYRPFHRPEHMAMLLGSLRRRSRAAGSVGSRRLRACGRKSVATKNEWPGSSHHIVSPADLRRLAATGIFSGTSAPESLDSRPLTPQNASTRL